MAQKSRMAARPLRWLARLLITPSTLRRRSDRIEGMIVVLLSAAFLAAVAAAPFVGEGVYHAQRAEAARLHPATAVLIQNGPASTMLAAAGETAARWRAPDGQQRSGMLSTTTVPVLWNAHKGDRVRVWLTDSGQPESQPSSPLGALLASIVITAGFVFGVAIAVFVCYWLCRLVLDRRRLAAWASEWSMTGPPWTTRL